MNSLRRLGFAMLFCGWAPFGVAAEPCGNAPIGDWWTGFTSGPNTQVECAIEFEGRLIIGGPFTEVGGLPIEGAAAWDGHDWSPLGEGPGGIVNAMTIYNGRLIAAGYLTDPADYMIKYVMSWDGTSWSRLGGQFGASIWCLTVHNGELIAGGYFQTLGGEPCRGVAAWNGQAWRPLGDGLTDNYDYAIVWALESFDGQLYAGGPFRRSGDRLIHGLGRWDGSAWYPVAAPLDNEVGALMVDGDALLVGGEFQYGGDTLLNGIGRWTGTEWQSLGEGVTGSPRTADPAGVNGFVRVGGRLYVFGSFLRAGGVDLSQQIPRFSFTNMATWDGARWSGIGLTPRQTNSDGYLKSLAPFQGDVLVLGRFDHAGGVVSPGIARWSPDGFCPGLREAKAVRISGGVRLTWDPAGARAASSAFRVFRSIAGEPEREISTSLVGGTNGSFEFVDNTPTEFGAEYRLVPVGPDVDATPLGQIVLAPAIPAEVILLTNRPNPFRETTRLTFKLPEAGTVTLRIVDPAGRVVVTPVDDVALPAGPHELSWDGRDADGRRLPAGIYLSVLTTPGGTRTSKIVIGR